MRQNSFMQLEQLHKKFDELQKVYGAPTLSSIYGAGAISQPKLMFVFMNPTGRNIGAQQAWNGLRAPWIGTKNVWSLFEQLNLIPKDLFATTQVNKPHEWTKVFSEALYQALVESSVYVTNLAKCTQFDARSLPDSVYLAYRELFLREIETTRPRHVVSFGNQVSSIILQKKISVSNYSGKSRETIVLNTGAKVAIYPTHYPVGQGRRNMPLAVTRIREIMSEA